MPRNKLPRFCRLLARQSRPVFVGGNGEGRHNAQHGAASRQFHSSSGKENYRPGLAALCHSRAKPDATGATIRHNYATFPNQPSFSALPLVNAAGCNLLEALARDLDLPPSNSLLQSFFRTEPPCFSAAPVVNGLQPSLEEQQQQAEAAATARARERLESDPLWRYTALGHPDESLSDETSKEVKREELRAVLAEWVALYERPEDVAPQHAHVTKKRLRGALLQYANLGR